jgi:hypothetical protein
MIIIKNNQIVKAAEDGDKTAIPRLSANYEDVRVALDYRDAWGDGPSAALAPLRYMSVKMPDDQHIRPSLEVARQHEREDAEARAAEEAARLEASQALRDEMSRTLSAGRAISD